MVAPVLPLMLAVSATPCSQQLEVISASGTYKTRTFQGKPLRRDANIEVTLRSTATTSISAIELGVFLGVSLEGVRKTRPATLPTARYREFDGGGLAFRTEITTMIAPGATKKVAFSQRALPLAEDVYAVTAVVVSCRSVALVANAVLDVPAEPSSGPPGAIIVAIGILVLIVVVMIMRQLR